MGLVTSPHRFGLRALVALVALTALAAPAGAEVPSSTLDAVMRRAHFAFREAGGVFSGGHGTYRADVARDGSATITPYLDRRSGAPLTLATRAITRGARRVADRAGAITVTADGALAITRGPVVERLENTADGLAQSWRFAAAPAGEGDLVVTVALAGASAPRDTSLGHVVADPSTRLGLRYGRATWIDAGGARAELVPVLVGDALEIRVPAEVVARSAFPAVLDPVVAPIVSGPFDLDVPVPTPAAAGQQSVASVWAGGVWLAMWSDTRAGGLFDLYATRVSAAGVVLDPYGLHIAAQVFNNSPALATDGTQVLAVFERNVTGLANGEDIYGLRVHAATGAVLDPGGFVIAGSANRQITPAVTYGGGRYVVAWEDRAASGTSQIHGARVSTAGMVLDTTSRRLSPASQSAVQPAITHGTSELFVAWNAGGDIYGTRLTSTLTVRNPNGIAVSTATNTQSSPSTAYDGADYQVAWTDLRAGSSDWNVYGARVSTSGSVRDPSGFAIATGAGSQSLPRLASGGGGQAFVVWNHTAPGQPTVVRGSRLKGKSVVDGAGITIGDGSYPRVAYGDGKLAVTYSGATPGWTGSDAYMRRIASNGVMVDPSPVLLSQSANGQRYPHVVAGQGQYLAMWHDLRAGGVQLLGARFDADGEVLDAEPIAISDGPVVGTYVTEVLAAGGGGYLAVWSDDSSGPSTGDLRAARIDADGVVLDPGGFPLVSAPRRQLHPRAEWAAGEFLVVWSDERANPTQGGSDVYALRLREDANGDPWIVDPGGAPIATGPLTQDEPSVTAVGDVFVVAWNALDGVTSASNVVGARVVAGLDGPLTLLDPEGVVLGDAAPFDHSPQLASDGVNALLAWETYTAYQQPRGLVAARVSVDPAGPLAPIDAPVLLSEGVPYRLVHDVAFGGSSWLVLYGEAEGAAAETVLKGVRVGEVDGALVALDAGGFVIDARPQYRWTTAASLGDGSYAVVYDQFDERPDRKSMRVWARLVDAP